MSRETIHREPSKTKYTIMHSEFLGRTDLSMKAKALLAYILTLPNDWRIYMKELVKHFKEGVHSVRSAMNELEKLGFVFRETLRNQDGTFKQTIFHVYELPREEDNQSINGLNSEDDPRCENPLMDYPLMDNPRVENRTLLNTNKEPSTNLTNNIHIAPAIEKIILLWNQYQISRIPANRERTEKGILAALGQHGEEAVMKAVHNYFKILSDDTSLLDTRWQCYIFMETHIEKFLDLESARNLYKGGGNGTSRKYPSRNGSKTSTSTERPDREHYTGGKYGGFFAADESDEDS